MAREKLGNGVGISYGWMNKEMLTVYIITELFMYCIYPCISRPPILEPKNRFFSFLYKNFLEKRIFYVRIFLQVCYGYKKNWS